MTDVWNIWNNDTIRALERASIREFVESCAEHLTGRVLDFGCGKQPYRDIVEAAGGNYVPYDRVEFPGNVSGVDVGPRTVPMRPKFGAVLLNQVIQYVPVYGATFEDGGYGGWFTAEVTETPLLDLLRFLAQRLRRSGHLVMTYPTCWDEVEPQDLCRWTKAGMENLLAEAEYTVVRHERRADISLGGFRFPLGYGVVARA